MSVRPVTALLIALAAAQTAVADEAGDLVARLLAPPALRAVDGFSARLLVPPGRLYDPLVMRPHGDAIWLNDDGGEDKTKGSRLLAVSRSGELSVLADVGRILPTVGFDIAPDTFGNYGGHVFTLAQPVVALPGALSNHVIQRVEPANAFATSIFCTLPEAGEKKISGFGLDARFGPPGSRFANRLFVVTIFNNAVYEVTANGVCRPFVVFDGERYSGPTNLAFTPDGAHMLVSVTVGAFDIESTAPPEGAIVAVSADGGIAESAVVRGHFKPMGMAYAPPGFGAFAGELFFADIGHFQVPVPMTQTLNADGRVFRLNAAGKPELVASGLLNPVGVHFVNGRLWITDINGDFIAGKRELPDGFIVEITVPE